MAFANTGDPNNPRLPHWRPYEPQSRATLVFNNETELVADPRGEIRQYWDAQPPPWEA